MSDRTESVQPVLEFLTSKLCDPRIGFRVFGPHTLIYSDERDQILVYINTTNVVIVHDGPHVIDGIETMQIIPGEFDDDILDSRYLQPILSRF